LRGTEAREEKNERMKESRSKKKKKKDEEVAERRRKIEAKDHIRKPAAAHHIHRQRINEDIIG
jgi:hypothetical protein